ncbi:hypothetical protein IF1G_06094 [Cordyceps javanica]|uniref:Uncharacterized protein n=1 Tax=Cordyceps javanica TaxID=43265 RepID=A0A545V087_9HYPO|nr:hypothetical protein IF1G_06094 [Cordyceps javanica]
MPRARRRGCKECIPEEESCSLNAVFRFGADKVQQEAQLRPLAEGQVGGAH